jgi:hypothetical protein
MNRHRRGPVRIGPMPTLPTPFPDKAVPVYQAKVKRLSDQLVAVLTQRRPPGDRGPWATKYNAKMFPESILLRAPTMAGTIVPVEWMEQCVTAADWETLARKLITFLDAEYAAVMEAQTASREYHTIQALSGGDPRSN